MSISSIEMKADFSIIVPAYNVADYIDQTLDSILRSTHRNFKIICVDDASTDSTADKLDVWKNRDSRITVLKNTENIGVGLSRRRALEQVDSDYLFFVDADDRISPHLMSICKQVFEEQNPDGIVYEIVVMDADGTPLHCGTINDRKPETIVHPEDKAYLFYDYFNIWRKAWKTDFLLQNIDWIETRLEDDEFLTGYQAVVLAKKLILLPDALYYYRTNRANSLVSGFYTGKNELFLLDGHEVRRTKAFFKARFQWETYKEYFVRAILAHLMFKFPRYENAEIGKKAVNYFWESLDDEEKEILCRAKFPPEIRRFIRDELNIEDADSFGWNVYCETIPLVPDRDCGRQRFGEVNLKETIFENDFMVVHSGKVGLGKLGVDELGFGGPLVVPEQFSLQKHVFLGAASPSFVRVTFLKKVALTAFMNATSTYFVNSVCRFIVSGKTVARLMGPGECSDNIFLEPGTYTLETESLRLNGKHSVWAIRTAD